MSGNKRRCSLRTEPSLGGSGRLIVLALFAAGLLGLALSGWFAERRGASKTQGEASDKSAPLSASLPHGNGTAKPAPSGQQDRAHSRASTGPSLAQSARKQASLLSARTAGFQSGNYRDYVHQVLRSPDAGRARVAHELDTYCSYQEVIFGKPRRVPEMDPAAQAQLLHRRMACEASGGIDAQQRRALSALAKKYWNEPEWLGLHPLGTAEEIATLAQTKDVAGALAWGQLAAESPGSGFPGEESALKQSAPDQTSLAGLAWMAAVCEKRSCDDLQIRISFCFGAADCRRSLAEILEQGVAEMGLSKAQWRQMVDAAGRRVDVLFPG